MMKKTIKNIWGLKLSGLSAGSTNFTIYIWHQVILIILHSQLRPAIEEICPIMGDLNNSGFVNVADVVYLVNYILGATTLDVTCTI